MDSPPISSVFSENSRALKNHVIFEIAVGEAIDECPYNDYPKFDPNAY